MNREKKAKYKKYLQFYNTFLNINLFYLLQLYNF